MSATNDGRGNEDPGSLFSDGWIRDVTKMGIGWLIGTVIAIFLLLYVGPMVL
jgi:hypothetical protein